MLLGSKSTYLLHVLLRPRSRWTRYSIAALSPTLALLLVWVLQRGGNAIVPLYPVFTLAVFASAIVGGLRAGLLAHGLCLLYVYFMLLPTYQSTVGRHTALVSYVAFSMVGLAVSIVIAAFRTLGIELDAIVDSMSERLYVCDGQGRPLLMNKSFRNFYADAAPVYPQSFEKSVDVYDLEGNALPLSQRPVSRVLRGEKVKGLELQVKPRGSDSVFFNSYNAAPVLDARGKVRFVVLTVQDITEQRQAQDALRRQAELLRISFDAIILWRWDGTIEDWNLGAERVYGYTAEEALGKVTHELFATVFPKPWPGIRAEIRKTGLWEGELRHRRRDGAEIVVSARLQLVRNPDGSEHVLEANRDITQHKLAEESLIRSEKLAATGRLAATIAHEVNNPLAAATNALFLALADHDISEGSKKFLRMADQELRRAAHITQQALGFYRETGSSRPVALPNIIDEVINVYANKIEQRKITVSRRFSCGPCHEGCEGCFLVNAGEVRQMVSNLLANGIDALNDNGCLFVRASRTTAFNDGAGQLIHMTIADNGCGIRVENLKRIFEPFYTTKEAVGTGLGLWVTQELVRKHGGAIKVRSKEGKGTVFRLTFPALGAKAGNQVLRPN